MLGSSGECETAGLNRLNLDGSRCTALYHRDGAAEAKSISRGFGWCLRSFLLTATCQSPRATSWDVTPSPLYPLHTHTPTSPSLLLLLNSPGSRIWIPRSRHSSICHLSNKDGLHERPEPTPLSRGKIAKKNRFQAAVDFTKCMSAGLNVLGRIFVLWTN